MLHNYSFYFGGIIRYTLAQDEKYLKAKITQMKNQCNRVTAETLCSISTGIDDDLSAPDPTNLGGFVASYHEIPVDRWSFCLRKHKSHNYHRIHDGT